MSVNLLFFKIQLYNNLLFNTFLFRAPIVWNSLDSRSRFSEELDVFKAELKRNKKQLKKVSFSRGTITNSNKDLGNFIYF